MFQGRSRTAEVYPVPGPMQADKTSIPIASTAPVTNNQVNIQKHHTGIQLPGIMRHQQRRLGRVTFPAVANGVS